MDANKRLFRYLGKDLLKALGIFWLFIIIVSLLATNLFYNLAPDLIFGTITINGEVIRVDRINSEALSFSASIIIAIFIFFIIYGIVIYYENFSLAGNFGITRRNFYLHVILNNVIAVVVSAIMQILLLKVDNMLISSFGYKPIVDYGLFNLNNNIIYNMLLLSFSFLIFSSLSNLLGALVYRFSYRFWIALGIAGFIIGMFGGNLESFVMSIVEAGFFAGFIVIILSYILGYLVFRRVNVK